MKGLVACITFEPLQGIHRLQASLVPERQIGAGRPVLKEAAGQRLGAVEPELDAILTRTGPLLTMLVNSGASRGPVPSVGQARGGGGKEEDLAGPVTGKASAEALEDVQLASGKRLAAALPSRRRKYSLAVSANIAAAIGINCSSRSNSALCAKRMGRPSSSAAPTRK